jgi:hypothetical protein
MDPFGLGIGITAVTLLGICLVTVVSLAGTGAIIYFVMRAFRPDTTILKQGTPAKAVIQQVWQTGAYINNNPQIGMQLEVQPTNGAPYVTQLNAVIPLVNIPQFQPGAVVPVKIHPQDPSKVALDVYGPM